MSTVDPTTVPEEVGAALRKLITVCAKHDMPISALLAAPDTRRIMSLECSVNSLTHNMAQANLTIIKLRKKLADYEEI